MKVKIPKLSLAWTYVMMTSFPLMLIGEGVRCLGHEMAVSAIEILGAIFLASGLLLWIALCFKVWLLFAEGIEYEEGD